MMMKGRPVNPEIPQPPLQCTDHLKSAASRLLLRLQSAPESKIKPNHPKQQQEQQPPEQLRPVRLGLGAARPKHDTQSLTNPAMIRMKGKVAGLKRQRDREEEDLVDVREKQKRRTEEEPPSGQQESRTAALTKASHHHAPAPSKLILSKDELRRQRKKDNKKRKTT
jgi:hypothetical protein